MDAYLRRTAVWYGGVGLLTGQVFRRAVNKVTSWSCADYRPVRPSSGRCPVTTPGHRSRWPPMSRWWSSTEAGTIGELAKVHAGFRDQYYGLVDAVARVSRRGRRPAAARDLRTHRSRPSALGGDRGPVRPPEMDRAGGRAARGRSHDRRVGRRSTRRQGPRRHPDPRGRSRRRRVRALGSVGARAQRRARRGRRPVAGRRRAGRAGSDGVGDDPPGGHGPGRRRREAVGARRAAPCPCPSTRRHGTWARHSSSGRTARRDPPNVGTCSSSSVRRWTRRTAARTPVSPAGGPAGCRYAEPPSDRRSRGTNGLELRRHLRGSRRRRA